MSKLYELSQNYSQLLDYVENEDIDLEVIADTLESIEDEIGIKFENISKMIKSLEGDIELFKGEEKRIATRRKAMENKVVWLKSYMLDSLSATKLKSVTAGTFKVASQKNPASVSIIDKDKLPSKFLTVPVMPEPVEKKKEILDALKRGEKVEGATIAPDTYHLRIR